MAETQATETITRICPEAVGSLTITAATATTMGAAAATITPIMQVGTETTTEMATAMEVARNVVTEVTTAAMAAAS